MSIQPLEASLQKTNEMLKIIADRFDWHDREGQAYDAMRSVLHALRDRLPPAEATGFAAQLPLVLKGTFYDGWNMSKVPVKMDREEFLARIRQEFKSDIEGGTEEVIVAVMDALRLSINPDEVEKVKGVLPGDIAALFG